LSPIKRISLPKQLNKNLGKGNIIFLLKRNQKSSHKKNNSAWPLTQSYQRNRLLKFYRLNRLPKTIQNLFK